MNDEMNTCTAFAGHTCIATGEIQQVARQVKQALDQGTPNSILIFDDVTSEPVEIDFRGTPADVMTRLEQSGLCTPAQAAAETETTGPSPRGPGRPKLGVVAREITLLPRHWDWLNSQPGGASVALRKLVEEARRVHAHRDRLRKAQESVYRFLSAMAGNLPGYEEALRALFANNADRFAEQIEAWPRDIRHHVRKISAAAFA